MRGELNSLRNERIEVPKNSINLLYWKKNLSTSKIAEIYKCNPETIRRRMIEYGIKRRDLYETKFKISKKELNKFYCKEKKSINEIAKIYGCCKWVIWNLMKRYKIKRRSTTDYQKWKDVGNLIQPLLKTSPVLSYIVGVILGDGWIYRRGYLYSIGLESTDKIFCENFMISLKKLGLNPCIILTKRGTWKTVASSKVFYYWFKSLRLKDIKTISREYPIDFLRGFHESEGCVGVYKMLKDGKYAYLSFRLTIVNTQKSLIMLIKRILKDLKFHPCIIVQKKPSRKPMWRLIISRKGEILRFLKEVNPCIKNLQGKTISL